MNDILTVATDGGSRPNPGPTGWAWVDEHGVWQAGFRPHGTNNIGELTAILRVLEAHPRNGLEIISDSSVSIGCITEYGPHWRLIGNTGHRNRELIDSIIDLIHDRDKHGLVTHFTDTRGHAGNRLNETADGLCTWIITQHRDGVEQGDSASMAPQVALRFAGKGV